MINVVEEGLQVRLLIHVSFLCFSSHVLKTQNIHGGVCFISRNVCGCLYACALC